MKTKISKADCQSIDNRITVLKINRTRLISQKKTPETRKEILLLNNIIERLKGWKT
jgi:hypothetical protein